MDKEDSSEPQIIPGGTFKDDRGSLRFVNDFSFDTVVRFYSIKHPDIQVVRAWQGHPSETKYFYPVSGRFVVAWVKIDHFENPSLGLSSDFHIMDAGKSEILHVPRGYANGLKALDPDSEIMIFSDLPLEESKQEEIRYDKSWWFDWERLVPLNSKYND